MLKGKLNKQRKTPEKLKQKKCIGRETRRRI